MILIFKNTYITCKVQGNALNYSNDNEQQHYKFFSLYFHYFASLFHGKKLLLTQKNRIKGETIMYKKKAN